MMPNARAVGMGEAYTALADDATALTWNPAGLSRLSQWSAHAMYHRYIENVSFHYLAAGHKVQDLGGVAAHFLLMDSGEMYKTTEDSSGNLAQMNTTFWVSSWSAAVGWGQELSGGLRVGAAAKWIQQEIDRVSTSGFAVDMGVQHDNFSGLRIGAVMQNLGLGLGGKALPLTIRMGAAGIPLTSLTVALEGVWVFGPGLSFRSGVEWRLDPQLALRAGYQTGIGAGGLSGLHTGVGTAFFDDTMKVDYALAPLGDFGLSHRVSLGLIF